MIKKYVVLKDILDCKPREIVVYNEETKTYISEKNNTIDFTPNQVTNKNYFAPYEIPKEEQKLVDKIIVYEGVPYTVTEVYYEFIVRGVTSKKIYIRATAIRGYNKDGHKINIPYSKELKMLEEGWYINSTGVLIYIIGTSVKNQTKITQLKRINNFFSTKEKADKILDKFKSIFSENI